MSDGLQGDYGGALALSVQNFNYARYLEINNWYVIIKDQQAYIYKIIYIYIP